MRKLRVLVACEESQVVCIAFRKLGHFAFSCDIQECSGGYPEWHINSDVLPLLNGYCRFTTQSGDIYILDSEWDIIIAHPPCTYLSKAGARWMYSSGIVNIDRYVLAVKAKSFFLTILNSNCKHICVENPTPLKIVNLPSCSCVIQPYEFGHPYSKRTCLWLKNLPPLIPTCICSKFEPYLPSNTSAFSKGRGGSRGVAHNAIIASKTFPGVGAAMASQFSDYILSNYS